jgi:hypothetical protein
LDKSAKSSAADFSCRSYFHGATFVFSGRNICQLATLNITCSRWSDIAGATAVTYLYDVVDEENQELNEVITIPHGSAAQSALPRNRSSKIQ